MSNASVKNVPVQVDQNVPTSELGRTSRDYISRRKVQGIAIEKYRSHGYGITFEDLMQTFSVKKMQAQRSLKYFVKRGVLFTAQSLISQGIEFVQNTSPQQYFPVYIKADILENLKKRKNSVLVQPTGVHLPNGSLNQRSSRYPLSSSIENQKAQSFLDVLLLIPYAPLYIHKLQLMLYIDKLYYHELTQKEGRVNRAKRHEETIGRRLVTHTFSPNGGVQIAVRSSDTPFKLETDEDVSVIFSFLGQVKDRLLYCISDIKEQHVQSIVDWILKECDLNKDIEISDKAQLNLPDIQLKHAGRVFRLYVKLLQGKAVCRAEESVKLNLLLSEALDNIRYPHKSIESKLSKILEINQQINEVLVGKYSLNDSTAQTTTSNDIAEVKD